jgi:hypothetical protein
MGAVSTKGYGARPSFRAELSLRRLIYLPFLGGSILSRATL